MSLKAKTMILNIAIISICLVVYSTNFINGMFITLLAILIQLMQMEINGIK